MDLGRHDQFNRDQFNRDQGNRTRAAPDPAPSAAGQALLAAAWAALATARVETVDIHLRAGLIVPGCTAIRIDGRLCEVATRKDCWTHLFPVEDVALVRLNPRGSRRPSQP